MADAVASVSALDGLFKDVYDSAELANWVERELAFLSLVERSTNPSGWDGRAVVIGARSALMAGYGSRGENAALPAAKAGSYPQMRVSMAWHYAVIELTHQFIRQSQSNRAAFASGLEAEVSGAVEATRRNLARQYAFGDGTGWLARCKSGGGTVNPVMYASPDVDSSGIGYPGARNLEVGQVVDAYTAKSGGALSSDSNAITAINYDTNTLTCTNTIDNDDFLFSEDSRGVEAMGLLGIVDDGDYVGTFQNLARSTNTKLKANTLDAGGTLRPWSRNLMDKAAQKSRTVQGGLPPQAIISRPEVVQVAADFIAADRRFDASEMTLDNGYKSLAWTVPGGGKVPWIDDFYAADHAVFFLRTSDLIRFVIDEIQWEDRTGSRFLANTDRKHAFESRLFTGQNLASRRCNMHTRLGDISYTALSS